MTAPAPATAVAAPNVVPANAQVAAPVPAVESVKTETFDAAYVAALRNEAAQHRTAKQAAIAERDAAKAEAKAQIAALLEAAGIGTKDDPAEAAKKFAAERDTFATERDEARNEAKALRVERALAKAASKHGGDEDLLTAVLSHNGELKKLDPSAADFQTSLEDLVKKTIEANGKLKTAPRAGGVSGADFTGGTGGPTDLQSKIDAAYKAKDFQTVIALKQQLNT